MKKNKKRLLQDILFKLANGYTYTETIEEYAPSKEKEDDNILIMVKKKISTHHVPPDMLAIKMLFEDDGQKINSFSQMTDEELVDLKNKLIKELSGGDG